MNTKHPLAGGIIKRSMRGMIALALVCLVSITANATAITFTAEPSTYYFNPFTYQESGYAFSVVQNQIPYNPFDPSVWGINTMPGGVFYATDDQNYDPSVAELPLIYQLQKTGGGLFSFNSLDFSMAENGPSTQANMQYVISGFLAGNPVFSVSGLHPTQQLVDLSTTTPLDSPTSDLIDTLTISFNGQVNNRFTSRYYLISDIDVTSSVPDQASTISLLAVALVPLFAVGIRRRSANA